jgi:nitrate/TMAO reductase-like tetraheme cytochrome c subunit
MYRDTANVEYETYNYTGNNLSHRNSTKMFKEKFGSLTKKTFDRLTTKDNCTCNITHNTESTEVWNLKHEPGASPLVPEGKYRAKRACDKIRDDDDHDDGHRDYVGRYGPETQQQAVVGKLADIQDKSNDAVSLFPTRQFGARCFSSGVASTSQNESLHKNANFYCPDCRPPKSCGETWTRGVFPFTGEADWFSCYTGCSCL